MISFKKGKIKVPEKIQPTSASIDESWLVLRNVFDKVFSDNTQDISFEKTYRVVYDVVRFKQEAELYNRIKEYLVQRFESLRTDTFSKGSTITHSNWEFLEKLDKVWKSTNIHLECIRDLTLYLERTFCERNRTPGIVETGLEIFNTCLLLPLKDTVNKEYVNGINDLRDTRTYDNPHTEVLERLGSMMLTILSGEDSFFVVFVQNYLLEESMKYYSGLSDSLSLKSIEGFQKVEELIEFETKLDETFLTSDAATKIIKCINKVLIWGNYENIVEPLLKNALDTFNGEYLKKLYYLTTERKYRLKLRSVIQDMINRNVSAIELDESEKKKSIMGSKWTSSIIIMFNKYNKLLQGLSFEVESNNDNETKISIANDRLGGLQQSNDTDGNDNVEDVSQGTISAAGLLNETFSNFFKQNSKHSAQYLSFYLDSCLKNTLEKTEINDSKNCIIDCVNLVRLLPDKDEFTIIYKNQLTKRLLQQQSSLKVEKFACKRINEETGSFWTHKLGTMLRDISRSEYLAQNFSVSQQQKSIGDLSSKDTLEFIPDILTVTSWPFQDIDDIVVEDLILPPQLETLKLDFEKFYNKKYNERTLKWVHSLGSIQIGFQFEKTYHDLIMPFYSALVFLLFENHDELTIDMILEMTNIPEQELYRQLLSLIMSSKSRILKKSPVSKTISKTDKFSINYSFTASTQKVKVQTIVGTTSSRRNENNNINNVLERERINATNAAIVRVLKRRTTLSHTELLERVTEEVKPIFTLQSLVFKKSLGFLITKEYVQRDPENSNLYHYIS
ncbi:similar to Saccharomyces cerevisiae YGR003W CUL3 Ubiquitin-protein ligase [Maudiozyma saulgeensis]|uniref:Similar to Saccharomyces cerevisiae YGR003W CUL3 Ubiquitin-protein ligase n=1 Tax=Maudiozyma saulgeensis TaxID=1789683 RepID=A0A1X7RA75_9SACH|nr:similar to Saccharomyces cerevisiae YGR003W CUL3 Ubiquitin-protein ligase [Kazachstania saulgeensis]